jgi:hypothetical protein
MSSSHGSDLDVSNKIVKAVGSDKFTGRPSDTESAEDHAISTMMNLTEIGEAISASPGAMMAAFKRCLLNGSEALDWWKMTRESIEYQGWHVVRREFLAFFAPVRSGTSVGEYEHMIARTQGDRERWQAYLLNKSALAKQVGLPADLSIVHIYNGFQKNIRDLLAEASLYLPGVMADQAVMYKFLIESERKGFIPSKSAYTGKGESYAQRAGRSNVASATANGIGRIVPTVGKIVPGSQRSVAVAAVEYNGVVTDASGVDEDDCFDHPSDEELFDTAAGTFSNQRVVKCFACEGIGHFSKDCAFRDVARGAGAAARMAADAAAKAAGGSGSGGKK